MKIISDYVKEDEQIHIALQNQKELIEKANDTYSDTIWKKFISKFINLRQNIQEYNYKKDK
jgi:hypothetical protein